MQVEAANEVEAHIRWLIPRDMPEVLDIEWRAFEFPWTGDDFNRCLRQRNIVGMVVERDNRIIGFVIYELHKGYLDVLNIAVDYECRRQGVGRQMMDRLIGKLSSQNRTHITVDVRESNLDAQLFFKANGFRATGISEEFYENCADAAIHFRKFHGE